MNVISTEQEFKPIEKRVNSLVKKSMVLPENVFNERLCCFTFLTFYEILTFLFFDDLNSFLKKLDESNFFVCVMDPNPRSYFAKHFNFFGSIKFSDKDNKNDYISALNNYPMDSPADALMYNSNELVISSVNSKYEWAIFAQRDVDLAICAFSDSKEMSLFQSSYTSGLLGNVEEAAIYAYGESGDSDLIRYFCGNYSG